MVKPRFKITKTIVIAVFVACIFWFTGPGALTVRAFTAKEIVDQIKILQEQIAILQNQLNELQQEEVTNILEEEKEKVITQAAYSFTRNLKYGDSGTDVRSLQECLKTDSKVYPEGLVTGYFGSLTKAAVIRFQEKYADEILEPLGLSKGTGFVGKSTRVKLNALSRSAFEPEKELESKAESIALEIEETGQQPKSEIDNVSPIILELNVLDITADAATISWRTNKITKPIFYFGTSISNMARHSFNVWVDSYQVRRNNLEVETTYYFKIEVQDKEGHKTTSPCKNFTTLNLCAGITCSTCYHCVDGKCVIRSDGYNDCGEGCQRCVSGRCQDYDSACITFSHCENDQCKPDLSAEIFKPIEFPKIEIPEMEILKPKILEPKTLKPIEFPRIEDTPKPQENTKGPCKGLDMRDFDWRNPLYKSDRQWQEKYECQQYLEKLFQQDLENNPQLRKEWQKVQNMPSYIPPQSLPKNFGGIEPLF